LQPLQVEPSTPPLQNDDPLGGTPQVPTLAPLAMLQLLEQQSEPRAHTSPCWMQNEAARSHSPSLQKLEQHSLLAAQVLPAVLQLVLSARHVPPMHD
jgi:hypothetical protein